MSNRKTGDQGFVGLDGMPCRQSTADQGAALTTSLYHELRRIAKARMAGGVLEQTLQATALVHEAWMKVERGGHTAWTNRDHYMATVATAMRCILVDRARKRQAIRHGGGLRRVNLDSWNWELADSSASRKNDHQLLRLNDALEQLATMNAEAAELLNLKVFGGLTNKELCEISGLSKRIVERRLSFAMAWIWQEMTHGES